VSRTHWTLVALLVASTAVFAVGVTAERSQNDAHVEVPAAHAQETGAEPEGVHDETGESGEAAARETRSETAPGETGSERERVLGVDLEPTPLIVLAVLAGLALAVVTATRLGRLRGFLLAVAGIALAWAVLDLREFFHQFDESHTGVALIAMSVTVLHLAAAAVSGRLARHPGATAL
jgi:hypothetical protein